MQDDKELQERVQMFQSEIVPLFEKYKLGLGAEAFLMPDGRVGARPVIVDQNKVETPSDLVKP